MISEEVFINIIEENETVTINVSEFNDLGDEIYVNISGDIGPKGDDGADGLGTEFRKKYP